MADSLYRRYLRAAAVHGMHGDTCPSCSPHGLCPIGHRAYDSFVRLQEAYLNRLRADHRRQSASPSDRRPTLPPSGQ